MKYKNKLIKYFSKNTDFVRDNQSPEYDYMIPSILPPSEHLPELEPKLNVNKRYEFTEMFDSNGEFEPAYVITECNYLTYRTSFPGDALIEPGPCELEIRFAEIQFTLGHFNTDSWSKSSIIKFYDSGMAKHTIRSQQNSKIVSVAEGWYDRQTSNRLYSEFESFGFEEWKDDFTEGYVMFDGDEWRLTVINEDGTKKSSYGYIDKDKTPNWQQVRSFFNVSSTFNRQLNMKSPDECSPEIDWKVQRSKLFKFIAIYLMLPFIPLFLFMFWVWIHFGAK
jgi:hypothetical protein